MGAARSTARQDQINVMLPPELLHKVFLLLAPEDIKAAVLVCRLWREVGEAPSLWSWVVLRVTSWDQTDMLELLERRRMKNVKEVRVMTVTDEVLQAVIKHEGLRLIKVQPFDLNSVDPTLLARAGPKMKLLQGGDFTWSRLSPTQQLKVLEINGNHHA